MTGQIDTEKLLALSTKQQRWLLAVLEMEQLRRELFRREVNRALNGRDPSDNSEGGS